MTDLLEILARRGMIHDQTPGLAAHLSAPRKAYIGVDPTASSLHIGNLATLNLLYHWAQAGHQPMILIGGATGMIGDPSGKQAERQLLDTDTLKANQEGIARQVAGLIPGAHVEVVNNYDWFANMTVLEFLREAGKSLTVNYMMAKDSVKNRLDSGISFTEFSYQLLQAYDFLHLYRTAGVTVQMGGSDQWGNITSGTELIRRLAQGDAYALTTPLLTQANGAKFGKSEQGNLWLDPARTSPYRLHQYLLGASDQDAEKFCRVLTLEPLEVIEETARTHEQDPAGRALQKLLADSVVSRLHGAEALTQAQAAARLLFGKSTLGDWEAVGESVVLDVLDGVPTHHLTADEQDLSGISLADGLTTHTGGSLFASKGEFRRALAGGGVSVNLNRITGDETLGTMSLLFGQYLVVQKGKKNFHLVRVRQS